MSFAPDFEHSGTIDNWVTKLDLVCASDTKIMMISTALFAGWFFGVIVVPRLADTYGRTPFIKYGSLLQLIAYTMVLTASSYSMLICAMSMLGLLSSIRVQVCLVYLSEHLKRDVWNVVILASSLFEAAIQVSVTLYFKYGSKDIFWFLLTAYCVHAVGSLGVHLYFVESPKFLVESSQHAEASEAIAYIARFNGCSPVAKAQELLADPHKLIKDRD